MKRKLALALLAIASGFAKGEGVPDPAFGVSGLAVMDHSFLPEANEYVTDGQIDEQGRYVTVGIAYIGAQAEPEFAQIARILPSGKPDPDFVGTGVARFRFGSTSSTTLHAVATLGDRIVAVGTTNISESPELLVCQFAGASVVGIEQITNGCMRYNIPVLATNPDARQMKVAFVGDSKILVLTAEPSSSQRSYRLIRINLDGSLDTTFGQCECGTASSDPLFQQKLEPASMAVDPLTGEITVTSFETIFSTDIVITRHLADGNINTGFAGKGWLSVGFDAAMTTGNQGFVPFPVKSSVDRPVDVVIQNDGKAIVLASIQPVEQYDDPGIDAEDFERAGMVRIRPDGAIDESFGGPWFRQIFGFGTDFEHRTRPGALAVQQDGAIITAGVASFPHLSNASVQLGITRFLADGGDDQSWANPQIQSDGIIMPLHLGIGEVNSFASRAAAMLIEEAGIVVFGHGSHIDAFNSAASQGFLARLVLQRPEKIFSDSLESE